MSLRFLLAQYAFKGILGEFPGGPVVRTRCLHWQGTGAIPGQGTKIPQAAQCGQKEKKDLGTMIVISCKFFTDLDIKL